MEAGATQEVITREDTDTIVDREMMRGLLCLQTTRTCPTRAGISSNIQCLDIIDIAVRQLESVPSMIQQAIIMDIILSRWSLNKFTTRCMLIHSRLTDHPEMASIGQSNPKE